MFGLPRNTKPIIIAAIVLNLVVFTGLSRAVFVQILMMISNLAVCLVIYWALVAHFVKRPSEDADDQSPSRKSSPISE